MVVCFIALAVFGVLGIFSAKYRGLAKEAFDCVAKKVTLRRCDAAFDQKVKKMVFSSIFRFNGNAAFFVFKNFQALSVIFVILMLGSFAFAAYGVYNFVAYGNCNGPHSNELCLFNPEPNALSCGSQHCATEGCECGPRETNCTESNNYAACDGNCDCFKDVCGGS